MPIADLQEAAQKIAGFLANLNKLGGLRLKYRITAGDGARDPEGLEARQIYVELGGPDVPLSFDSPATIAIGALPGAEIELENRPSLRVRKSSLP